MIRVYLCRIILWDNLCILTTNGTKIISNRSIRIYQLSKKKKKPMSMNFMINNNIKLFDNMSISHEMIHNVVN